MHVDVIPCAVEFSGMEKENKNCSLREVFRGLIESQTGTCETEATLQSNK